MKKSYYTLTIILSTLLTMLIPIQSASAKSLIQDTAVSNWVKAIKFKGDLRLRYQLDQNNGQDDRSRGRVRGRLGMKVKVTEDVKVGIGIASGPNNARTTNQTFENSFDTPNLRYDYLFAEYEASENATVYAGKFARSLVLWHPSDLLWDGDIRTEGAGVTLTAGPLFFNAAGFILDENKSASDPTMGAIQSGGKIRFGDVSIKGAVSYYGFGGVQGKSLDFSSGSNSTVSIPDPTDSTKTIQVLAFDYDSIVPSIEVTIKEPFGESIPNASLFGEYVNSFDPSDENTGFLVGVGVGNKKVTNKKEWRVTYLYRRLEQDAWIDVLPDSDFALGKTGYKGHEVIAQIGLKKNVIFGLDYYTTDEIRGNKEEEVLQIDLLLKF